LWAAFFNSPVVPLIDSAVLDLVAGTGETYGRIRVWGSIGFTLITWLVGLVLREQGLNWLFYSYAGLLTAAAFAALGLPARRQSWAASFGASLGRLLRQRPLLLFLAGSFLTGSALQTSYSFFPLYLQRLGGDAAWVGAAGAISALSEMPVIFFSSRLFQSLGVAGALALGHLAFAVRWWLLSGLRAPALALATQAMHGLSFGPFLTAGIAFVEERTPPGMHATAQSLLTAMAFGLGAAAGALGGGWLYDTVGPARMFAVGGGAAFLGMLAVLAAARMPREPIPA
jgi:PPP family 3-phenylpropionic acid transporter